MDRMDLLRARAREKIETIQNNSIRIFFAEKLGMHPEDLPEIPCKGFANWFNDRYGSEVLKENPDMTIEIVGDLI